jgi:Ca2+-binding RTX toxin-like protein
MAKISASKKIGTAQADEWQGSNGNDRFNALAGNDLCIGGKGSDVIDGGTGNDEVEGGQGGDTIVGGAGSDVLTGGAGDDTIEGGAGKDTIDGGAGDDDIDGGSGKDQISGGEGDDTLAGGSGTDRITGDAGDDNIDGGSGNDQLAGGDGNDFVIGATGDDLMLGGAGDDTLDWDDGDGNDIMSGGDGLDTIEVDGSVARGDNFVLGKNAAGKAFFERVGLDGQAVGQFNLTVDTAEVFDVSGEGGNDTFIVNDLTGTGVQLIQFDGGAGNDLLDARNSSTRVVAVGGEGDDILIGGTGTIVGANNVTLGDTLTGGLGKDKFQFSTNPFANGSPAANLNQPDVVTDYEIGVDQIVLDKLQTGISVLKFQNGSVAQLSGDNNLLVLQGGFANAGAAAAAIRDNNNISAGKGAFVYFNQTLGFSRVVFSQDLANGGTFSVLANLTNQTNVANQANFSAADFGLA